MTAIRKLAVIGATGMLGAPVTRALAEAGYEVTALVRDVKAARRHLPAPIALVEADVRDEESLRAGLVGQDGLYLNLSVSQTARPGDFHTEAQGIEHIISAARDADIKRLSYVSALIHDTSNSTWWVLDVWRQALARIKNCGIPYTIFYPTNFMETLAQRHSTGGVFVMLGRSHQSNYWIAAEDFGRQVARSFALPQAANREYVVQGPEPLTYDEAASRYLRARPRPARFVRIPMELARLGGLFSRELDYNARVMETVLQYPETFKAEATWNDLGVPATTIEQFAAQQRA